MTEGVVALCSLQEAQMVTEGVIAICSRGLVHSRILQPIWRNLAGRRESWELITTDDKPIPQAQNAITEKALAYDPTWIWYVEEDIGLPDGILNELLEAGKTHDVVTADYRLSHGMALRLDKDGEVVFGGMGCLLVRAAAFQRLECPYFRSNALGDKWAVLGHERTYGGQDVYFFRECIQRGLSVGAIRTICRHYRLEQPGALRVNQGVHKVVELER